MNDYTPVAEEVVADDYVDNEVEAEETEEVIESESDEPTEEPADTDEGSEDGLTAQEEEDLAEYIDIKYNGEEKKIALDEARVLAQKGMNYDKILGKLEEAKNDPLRKWAETFMEKNGFKDPNDFLEAVKKDEEERKINELVQKNIPREYAEKLLEVDKIKEELESNKAREKEEQENSEFLDWHDSMVEKGVFSEKLDPAKIPSEVWDRYRDGVPLKTAYMEHALENLRKEAEQDTIKKITKNKKSTPGSVNSDAKAEDAPLTIEEMNRTLEQMTPDEQRKWVKKNYAKIEKLGYFG